jgi:DNA invertase Pin-like site-specific DNA recombinase
MPAVHRAALYARYSTDNQRQTSTQDQLRNCRAVALREGLEVAREYSDEETSAYTPLDRRPGSAELLADALAGRWQVLVIEALDRFSRNLLDQERVVRRLEHRGIRIIGYTDGYDSTMKGREFMRQMRGTFNEEQLRVIAEKTHRGLDGQIERGYHAGGLSYGYRSVVAGVDAKGEPIGHRLEVDPRAAGIVREIFARYAHGESCAVIAHDLNRRKVPAPRGGTWAVSALFGSPRKGSGILNNRLYVGEYVWNRSRWVKDPDTGRRQRLDRPAEEWKIAQRADLVVVDAALWKRVRARMDKPRLEDGSRGRGARPSTLFGGLVKCGRCGGAVIAVSQWSYGCAARKDRGVHVCAGVRAPRKALDGRLLSLVRDEILSPEALATVQSDVARIVAEARRDRERAGARAQTRAAELDREIANLVDAVASAGFSGALKDRLRAAEAERAELQAAQASLPQKHELQGIPAAYRRLVADLQGSLARDIPRARKLLQGALGTVTLTQEGGEVYAEVELWGGGGVEARRAPESAKAAGASAPARPRLYADLTEPRNYLRGNSIRRPAGTGTKRTHRPPAPSRP